MRSLVIAAALIGALSYPAQAAGHHHHRHHHHHVSTWPWCGYYARFHFLDHDPGPQFNVARKWEDIGTPVDGPAPGVIGIKPHHVYKVLAVVGPGKVLAISGNDGGAVRTRVRSTTGTIAWRAVGSL